MTNAEIKSRCHICDYRMTIAYADGHLSLGCLKASPDGIRPVAVKSLERCPRSHRKRRDNTVDATELLNVLGKIYAEVSVTPGYISLNTVLKSAGPSVKKKAQHISSILVDMGILLVVSRSEKGRKGMRCKYIWNLKSVGPPSLEMVEKINEEIQLSVEKATEKEYERKAASEIKPAKNLLVDTGATRCEHCWLRDLSNCREKIGAMGLDCKNVNINTIRYA